MPPPPNTLLVKAHYGHGAKRIELVGTFVHHIQFVLSIATAAPSPSRDVQYTHLKCDVQRTRAWVWSAAPCTSETRTAGARTEVSESVWLAEQRVETDNVLSCGLIRCVCWQVHHD